MLLLKCDFEHFFCITEKSPTTERPEVDFKFIAITAGGSGGGFIALIIAALILRNR